MTIEELENKLCTACGGSGYYCGNRCDACNGTGFEYSKDDIIIFLKDQLKAVITEVDNA